MRFSLCILSITSAACGIRNIAVNLLIYYHSEEKLRSWLSANNPGFVHACTPCYVLNKFALGH